MQDWGCQKELGSPLAAFLLPAPALPCSNVATRRGKKRPNQVRLLLLSKGDSEHSWCFVDKTFDSNMNDANTLISSLRSFSSNSESRGVNAGSSSRRAPEGGDAVIRDTTRSISARPTHTSQGGGGLGRCFMKKTNSYSSERSKTDKTLYISKQRSSKTGKMLILLM